MKSLGIRFLAITIAFASVFWLFQRLPYRFFSIDFFALINASLFNAFQPVAGVDERVVVLNAGTKSIGELKSQIEFLLKFRPRTIGINLCHLSQTHTKDLIRYYQGNQHIIFSDCSQENQGLSRIVNEDNSVTHFINDDPASFERMIVDDVTIPFTNDERINYFPGNRFYQAELDSTTFHGAIVPNSIILIGYLGDYLVEPDFYSHQLRYSTNARITPLNVHYAYEDATPDMYDIEISAQIISSLMNKNWIRDVPKAIRITILTLFMILQSLLMYAVQRNGLLINIGVGLLSYFLIKFAGSFLIVFLFQKGYYLELDELMMLLWVVTAVNLGLNAFFQKTASPTPSS